MPYGSNPWMDLTSGTSGINQSMANVALAQRQAQYMAQQNAAKMALEQARLQIERDAEARAGRVSEAQIPMYNAETERYKAETKKYGTENEFARQTMDIQQRLGRLAGNVRSPNLEAMLYNPASRDQIMNDLIASSVTPRGGMRFDPQQVQTMMQDPLTGPTQVLGEQNIRQAILAALGGQTFQQGMGTAAAAERFSKPLQGPPNTVFRDPFSMQVMGANPPAPVNPETMRHNMAMEGKQLTPEQRLILAQMHAAAGAVGRPRADWQHVDIDELNNVLAAAGNRFMGKTNTPSAKGLANEVYISEDEARQMGAKSGDVVYIKGVGKVRLH